MLTELLYSAIECCKESRNERFSKFIISYHIMEYNWAVKMVAVPKSILGGDLSQKCPKF